MLPQAVTLLESCQPVRQLLGRVGDKWVSLIVMALREQPRRFNEIRRDIGAISQRMLTHTLRGMERDGLVLRTVTPTNPPRVDYELTALGHSLRVPLEALGHWAIAHEGEIAAAQARYDLRAALPAGPDTGAGVAARA